LVGSYFDNQEWTIFDIQNENVPTVEELLELDAVIITGSTDSVLNKSPYVQTAIDTLGEAYKHSKTLKMVGVCYGHQLILEYFGATVVRKVMVSKLESINFNYEILQKHPHLTSFCDIKPCDLTQLHEDFVENVPNGFDLIASSESCSVEATASKDGRVLTLQFHSEYPLPYMKRL
jgi:GMP synthase (glutamine-hydrolysing)